MATTEEDNDENPEGESHSDYEGSVDLTFYTSVAENRTQYDRECNEERDCETPRNSPRVVSRFPQVRRMSCPSIMARNTENCRYLMAGSNTLPEPVVSRAYQSLLSHRDPIHLEREPKPKSQRLLSYYDYVPSRKVFNEQEQFVKDQNREELKIELLIKERRKQLEAVAMEKELMGDDYKEGEDGGVERPEVVDEEEFREIMMRRRLRRLQVSDSAYQGFFPQMDLYDFNQHEKERQKQAHVSSVHGKGRMQRRASESHLRKHNPHGTPTNQHAASLERRNSRRDSLNDELSRKSSTDQNSNVLHHGKRLERTNTQTRMNPGLTRRSTATGLTNDKLVEKGVKLQVLNAMKPLPSVRRTISGITAQNGKQ